MHSQTPAPRLAEEVARHFLHEDFGIALETCHTVDEMWHTLASHADAALHGVCPTQSSIGTSPGIRYPLSLCTTTLPRPLNLSSSAALGVFSDDLVSLCSGIRPPICFAILGATCVTSRFT